nr:uncharacterized protein LOC112306760 isoform X3 [Desmodus rotundus]
MNATQEACVHGCSGRRLLRTPFTIPGQPLPLSQVHATFGSEDPRETWQETLTLDPASQPQPQVEQILRFPTPGWSELVLRVVASFEVVLERGTRTPLVTQSRAPCGWGMGMLARGAPNLPQQAQGPVRSQHLVGTVSHRTASPATARG